MSEAGRTRVIKVQWHNPDVFELWLERDNFDFVPGDCVALFGSDGQGSRPYSLASGIHDPELRFLIRQMEGGEVSPYLAQLQPGNTVKMSPPFGWFRPGQNGDRAPFVFMATGTGIAPFMAYLRSYPDRPPQQCYYGVRQRADAVAVPWLREQIDLRLAVSREVADDAHHGRIADLWADSLPLPSDTDYYLCGLDAMIDEATVWLQGQGVDIARIHRECFFNAEL